jgi:hypothetical protein
VGATTLWWDDLSSESQWCCCTNGVRVRINRSTSCVNVSCKHATVLLFLSQVALTCIEQNEGISGLCLALYMSVLLTLGPTQA